MPLVDGCTDAVAAVRLARLWWAPFTLGMFAGFWFILVRLFSDRLQATSHALIGVSLIALTPSFLRFAVQVRSDQPAIAAGLIAGALLIDSRRHIRLALVAGLLFGVGFLFSQKLAYVAALVSLLVAADIILKGDFQLRRELWRLLAVAGGFLGAVLIYRVCLSLFLGTPPTMMDVGRQMDVFGYYRETAGHRYYRNMLPYLVGPIGLLGLQLILLPSALRRGGQDRLLAGFWIMVLGLGLGVGVFHAAAFPYFWMTLGLFPATALAIGLPFFLRLPTWTRRLFSGPFWAVFIVTAVIVGVTLSHDAQATQRTTLSFVRANIPHHLEGFHPTRALFCRELDDPLPTFFTQSIHFEFSGEGASEAVDRMIAQFRDRPIGFLVHTFRYSQFPDEVRRFWAEHYVAYSGPIHVAGTSFDDMDPEELEFEVLVPGTYAFYSNDALSRIRIGIRELGPGDTIRLGIGNYTIDRVLTTGSALFALAIPAPPGPIKADFYQAYF